MRVVPSPWPAPHLAYHPSHGVVHSIIPNPSPSPFLSGSTSLCTGVFPRALVNTPRPINAGSVQLEQPVIITPERKISVIFKTRLRHPSHRLPRSRSLCLRLRVLNRRRRRVSQFYWPPLVTRHSSPANLILPQKFLQLLGDASPPPTCSPFLVASLRLFQCSHGSDIHIFMRHWASLRVGGRVTLQVFRPSFLRFSSSRCPLCVKYYLRAAGAPLLLTATPPIIIPVGGHNKISYIPGRL